MRAIVARAWDERRELLRRPPVLAGLILLVALLVLVIAFAWSTLTRPSGPDFSRLTPMQQVLREIRDDGTWSKETALRAFSAAFGPLPGVTVPDGATPTIESAGLPIRMLSLYLDEITPEQRAAAIAAAGTLAPSLTGEPRTGRLEIVLASASSDDYQAQVSALIPAIGARVKRQLPWDVAVTAESQKGNFHAEAEPIFDDDGTIKDCDVHVYPKIESEPEKTVTAILAHEVWHCYQFARLKTIGARNATPPWIMEGQAMWAGEAFVGGTTGFEKAIRYWTEYLVEPGPPRRLFARSYDAIGFFSHLTDREIDPWTVFDAMLDQTFNVSRFNAAVGSKSSDVVTTWGPSWYRDGKPTSTFALVNAPGIVGVEVRPTPATSTVSNGTISEIGTFNPLTAALGDIDVAADILVVDVIGQAMVGDLLFGAEYSIISGSRAFCMLESCVCPEGDRDGPTDRLGRNIRVAATGDALSGSQAQLRGWALDDWCEEDDETPPPTEPPDDDDPCEPDCASTNGDPHLTSVDGTEYDFQAAGEFTMLRAPDASLEIQARQEPFGSSDSVTINTAIAVSGGTDRVGIYAAGSRLLVRVNGTETDVRDGVTVGSLHVEQILDFIALDAADGTRMWALGLREYGINLIIAPSAALRQEGQGMLGPVSRLNLPKLPSGSDVTSADYREALYTELGDAWALTPETSRFDYEPGESPATFRDPSIPAPEAPLDFGSLSEALQRIGLDSCSSISEERLRRQCAFDVAVTEDEGFVEQYEATEAIITPDTQPVPSAPVDPAALLTGVQSITGSGVDDRGTLFLSVSFEDGHSEVVAIDPVGGRVVQRVEAPETGLVATASGSVWIGSTQPDCAIRRLDPQTLEEQARVAVECPFGFLATQFVAADDKIWVHHQGGGDPDRLRPIDPSTNGLGEGVELPFRNGYLRSTATTVFYSDISEGLYRLERGASAFEQMGTELGFPLTQPDGNGLWIATGENLSYHTGPGGPAYSEPLLGRLVGAIEGSALVRPDSGPELWAHPSDGRRPTALARAPTVRVGTEELQLDYDTEERPYATGQDGIAWIWLVPQVREEDGSALYVQWIRYP